MSRSRGRRQTFNMQSMCVEWHADTSREGKGEGGGEGRERSESEIAREGDVERGRFGGRKWPRTGEKERSEAKNRVAVPSHAIPKATGIGLAE
eukprot:1012177-Pleurochrysis_carterae.AAC.2